MEKIKRILALVGVVLLVAMYLVTLVFAITDNPATMSYFKASLFLTCAVPILIYGYQLVYRLVRDRANKTSEDVKNNK